MKSYKVQLKDLVSLVNGYPFKIEDRESSGKYPIIRIQNLNNNKSKYNYTNKVVNDKFIVNDGDILISWAASLGVYEWKGEDGLLNQHIFKVVFKEKLKIEKVYFKYLVNQILEELSYKAIGVGLKHLQKEQLDNYEIYLPDIETQSKQVKILRILEYLKEKRLQTFLLLDEYLESYFYLMFGDQILNTKGWEKRLLKDLGISLGATPLRTNQDYFMGNINWAKSGDLVGEEIFNTKETLTDEGLLNSKCKIYPDNTILIAMYGKGKTRGSVGLLKTAAACNQNCAVIEPNKYLNSIFLFSQLKYSYTYLRRLGKGAETRNLNLGVLKEHLVIVPPLELQNDYEIIYNQVCNLKNRLKKSLLMLDEYFQSIIYNIFTLKKKNNNLLDDKVLLEEFIYITNNQVYSSIEEYDFHKNNLFKLLESKSKSKYKIIQVLKDSKIILKADLNRNVDETN